jgi:hypothetical protein
METAVIIQKFQQFIASANDADARAIYAFIENQYSNYTKEELQVFYERRDKLLSGHSRGFSVRETHDYIRSLSNS